MEIIKKKSLVVAVVSSIVILIALIGTILGHLAYLEIKREQSKRNYQAEFARLTASNILHEDASR